MAVCSYVRQDYSTFAKDTSNEWYRQGRIPSTHMYAHEGIQNGLCAYLHQMDNEENLEIQQEKRRISLYERNHYSICQYFIGGAAIGMGLAGALSYLFLPLEPEYPYTFPTEWTVNKIGVFFFSLMGGMLGSFGGFMKSVNSMAQKSGKKIEQDRFIRLSSKVRSIEDRVQHAEQENVTREENIQLLVARDYFNERILSYQRANFSYQTNIYCNAEKKSLFS